MEFDLYATAPASPLKLPSIGDLQWLVFNDGSIIARPTNKMLDIWRRHGDILRAVGIERINRATPPMLDFRFTFDRKAATTAELEAALAIAKVPVPKKRRGR